MKVSACSKDIVDRLSVITSPHILAGKVRACETKEDVKALLGGKLVERPCVGVLYEGSRPAAGSGGRDIGANGEIGFSLLLLVDKTVPLAPEYDSMTPSQLMLDAMRDELQGQTTPAGNTWRWNGEMQASNEGSQVIWLQRWTTPVILVPKRR